MARSGVVRIEAARSALDRAGPPPSGSAYFAHMRVSTKACTRDVLLSTGTRIVTDAVAVLDWERAPLSAVFFEVAEGDEYEVEVGQRTLEGTLQLRSLLAFDRSGDLVAVAAADGTFRRSGTTWEFEPTHHDAFPKRSAARRSSTPLHVELDPAQRTAVELPSESSCLVLGEAGFGKTTVALHRLNELLLRAHAEGKSFAALVVVPTEGLCRLTSLVLDRLGAVDVEVMPFERWIEREGRKVFPAMPERLSEVRKPAISRLKRHPALGEAIVEVAVGTPAMRDLDELRPGQEPVRRDLLHLFGDRRVLDGVKDRAGGVITARAIDEVLAHTRIQFSPTTEQAHRDVDEERLRTMDGRRIDHGTPMHDADSLDIEDFPVLFELDRLRTGRLRGPAPGLEEYDHIVIDEAQELAPIELAIVGRALRSGASVTVAGDPGQQLDETHTFGGWGVTMADVGRPTYTQVLLTESYRCPTDVEALARHVSGLVPLPNGWIPAGGLRLTAFANHCHQHAAFVERLAEFIATDRQASIAIVVRTPEAARRLYHSLERGLAVHLGLDGDVRFQPGIQVTCLDEIRGLEFDVMVVPDVDPVAYPGTRLGRRSLYVAMTRASHFLWLTTTAGWSPLLPAEIIPPSTTL